MDPRVRVEDLPDGFRCGKNDCRCIVIKITNEQGSLFICTIHQHTKH